MNGRGGRLNAAALVLPKASVIVDAHYTGPLIRSNGSNRSSGSTVVNNAPIFLLIPQVKLPKRLALDRNAERVLDSMPGLTVANWVDEPLQ